MFVPVVILSNLLLAALLSGFAQGFSEPGPCSPTGDCRPVSSYCLRHQNTESTSKYPCTPCMHCISLVMLTSTLVLVLMLALLDGC